MTFYARTSPLKGSGSKTEINCTKNFKAKLEKVHPVSEALITNELSIRAY